MFYEIPFSGYVEMAPDGRTEGRTDGHGQTYIPPPSAGDKKQLLARFPYLLQAQLALDLLLLACQQCADGMATVLTLIRPIPKEQLNNKDNLSENFRSLR